MRHGWGWLREQANSKRRALAFVLAGGLFLLNTASALAQDASKRPVILAVGESTTAGFGVKPNESYPAQLQALLEARGFDYEVVNHGRSGSTTAMALGGLDRGLRLGPRIVIIALGGNDRGNRMAAERTRANLTKMVSLYKRAGAEVFLADRGRADGNRGDEPSLFATLASEEGAVLMPSLREDLAGHHFLADGSHPNAEGYAIVAERLFGILEPWLEKRAGSSP